MICDSCGGKGYLMPYMKHPGGPPCNKCRGTGWTTFWTPAERAGLKAMGKEFINKILGRYTTDGVKFAIRAYVNAARKSKEE